VALLAAVSAPGQDRAQGARPPTEQTADKAQDPSPGEPKENGKAQEKLKSDSEPEFVQKTDAEWRKILTRQQYQVTRMKDTEAPFTGRYASGHFRGTFLCVCCGAELFSSQHKFESGTGWPSFWQPIAQKALATAQDLSAGEPRIEVMCRRCGAHLGHVFDDGPAPTGLRFCINSISLKLRPPGGAAAAKPSAKTKSKLSAKAKAKARSAAATTKRNGNSNPAESNQPASDSDNPPSSAPDRPE
jgi:peptide-methionine (R)-S-oxide reductase